MNKSLTYHTMRSIAIVFVGIFSGFIGTELWKAMVTDYYLGFSVVCIIGLFALAPIAIIFFATLYLRRRITNELNFTNSDLIFLSFFSGLVTYQVSKYVFLLGSSIASASQYLLWSTAILMILICMILVHCIHWIIIYMLNIRFSTSLLIAFVLLVFAFMVTNASAKPSARDICRRIVIGDSENVIFDKLSEYGKRKSMAFYPPADYYTYGSEDNRYLLISPGLYCEVAVDGGVVTEVNVHSDSL